jgi:hypothetical protein
MLERVRSVAPEGAAVEASIPLKALVPASTVGDCRAALERRLSPEDVTIEPAPPGRYALRDDRLYLDATAVRHDALRAAGLGAVAGGAVAAAIAGTTGTPWPLFVGGAAVFAGAIGAMIGLQRTDVPDDDPAAFLEVRPGDGWALVTVHSTHVATRAHAILVTHGAQQLERTASQPLPAN